jgi:hypothetical protein
VNGWLIKEWGFDFGLGKENFLFSIAISSRNMSYFKSNKTLYDSDAEILLNVYIYLVFVGEGRLALVPSRLPHLRWLCLEHCNYVHDKYVKELVSAVPKLKVTNCKCCT